MASASRLSARVVVPIGAVLAIASLAFGVRCHGAGGREAPSDSTTKVETDAAPDATRARASELPAMWVVLDDARFADARAFEDDAKHADAAAALDADLAKTTSAKEKCEAEYVVGRLKALAGDDVGAATAFDAASCDPIADYARARAAGAYERAGKTAEAIARASSVAPSVAIAEEATLVRAEALAASGDRKQALTIWRDHLGKHPRGARWVDTTVRLATALLDGVDGDPKAGAREAYDLATRVTVDAPTLADSSGASAQRRRAESLDASLRRELTVDERLKRARAFLDAAQADKARAEVDAAIAQIPANERAASEVACRAESLRAQAVAKSKKSAAPAAWGDAIRACAKESDALASALFNGAKASTTTAPDEALARFARIEKEFPKHRLADDARLLAALVVHDRDVAKFESMLTTLPDDYPQGDMRSEALFRVALDHMARGDWEGAKAPLDRAAQIDGATHAWSIAGRAAYFRAKCAAKTGDVEDAKKRWIEVVKAQPLAYYMAQSYARLAEIDPALARSTLDEASRAETSANPIAHDRPELHAPDVARAIALLEVGEIDYAKREFAAAHATTDDADVDLVWTVAAMFDHAGAFDVGHALARGRLADYLAHYPSGRWRFAWETAYPKAFDALVTRAASDEKMPAPMIWGVMREESAFIADVRSPANAHGLMQLLPSTAAIVARGTALPSDETALHTPHVSVALGSKLLASLRAMFPDNASLAIPAYNAGAGAVRAWLRARGQDDFDVWVELIPFDETRGYTKRVLASELAYATLYDPPRAKEVLELPARAGAAPP